MIPASLFFLFYFFAPFSMGNAFFSSLAFLEQIVYTYVKWICGSTSVF